MKDVYSCIDPVINKLDGSEASGWKPSGGEKTPGDISNTLQSSAETVEVCDSNLPEFGKKSVSVKVDGATRP
jgi:hypothetical protein